MKITSLIPLALTSAVLALASACGGSDHPPPAGDSVSTASEMSLAAAEREKATPKQVCTPGASRECRIYTFFNGSWSCPMSLQFCRSDGFGWHKCGDFNPKEPDAGAPVDDAEPESDAEAPPVH